MRRLLPLLLAAAPLVVFAGEDAIELKPGPGRDLVETRCVTCHSLDYIPMNSPFLDRKGWEASVNKMIKVMGAPVPPEETQTIIDYLSTNYGR
jgi:cytochrome c5